jgi:hypothetical protein
MKRSPMKPATKPMSRVKPMKSRPKKREKINGIDYLALCRGQYCFIRLPKFAIHSVETVVPAHSNQAKHGKGMGIKASDIYTVPACFGCHFEIDQGSSLTREQKFSAWDAAYARWNPYRDKLLKGENHV